MSKVDGKAFDFNLFKRLMGYTKPYGATFLFVGLVAIALSVAGLLGPVFLKNAIDLGMSQSNWDVLLYYVTLMLVALVAEVILQFSFIYFANWLGQTVIRDIRVKLFTLMMSFKINMV